MTAGTTSHKSTPSQSGLGPNTSGVQKRHSLKPISGLGHKLIPSRGPEMQRGKKRELVVTPSEVRSRD